MSKIDVYDLDNSIASYISSGLKQYINVNEKTGLPTAPKYAEIPDKNLKERVKRWHKELSELAETFNEISKDYNASQEKIDSAFDKLKKIFKHLWIW